MAKSYYTILGVSIDASPEEIRSSYRRLVKAYHPDYYTGNRDTFHDIQEAYGVLGNDQQRRAYRRSLKSKMAKKPIHRWGAGPAPEPLIPESSPADFGDISLARSFRTVRPSFDEVFDWLWQNFSNLAPPKSGRMENLTLEVPLSPEQASHGGTARVLVPARAACPVCGGYGSVGYYLCNHCAGEGAITGEIPVAISFPPGIVGDHAVKVPLDRFGIKNLYLTVLFRTGRI
jgi:molecular chaperone DnaJ